MRIKNQESRITNHESRISRLTRAKLSKRINTDFLPPRRQDAKAPGNKLNLASLRLSALALKSANLTFDARQIFPRDADMRVLRRQETLPCR